MNLPITSHTSQANARAILAFSSQCASENGHCIGGLAVMLGTPCSPQALQRLCKLPKVLPDWPCLSRRLKQIASDSPQDMAAAVAGARAAGEAPVDPPAIGATVVQHAVLEDPDAKQYVAILLGLVEGVVAGVRAARQCRVAVAPQVANLRSSSMVGLSDSTELHSSHTRELCTGM